MVKIPVLLTLLLQLLWILMTVSEQSPCPSTFTYFKDNVTHQVMGKIWIQSPPKDQVEYHLMVEIAVGDRKPDRNYPGQVRLEKSVEDTIRDIQDGKPLVYIVHFPLDQPLTRAIKIKLNGEMICSDDDQSRPNPTYFGIIRLEHSLFCHNNTQKRVGRATDNLRSETGYEIGERYKTPTDASIFELIPPISSTTQAPTRKRSIDTPTTGDTVECGRKTDTVVPLIAGGVEVSPSGWPWVAALFVARRIFQYQCAGSILTSRHVITAAHCLTTSVNANLPPSSLLVSMGRNQLHEWREEGSVNVHVLNYTIHPDYAYNVSADSDLAILFLSSSIEFSPTVKPICLWTGPTNLENVVGKTGYMVVWGRDESGRQSLAELRMANMPIVSQAECLYSNPHFVTSTSNHTFCAGSRDGSGPCNNDGGSGLMLYDSTTDRYYIRGVTSRSLVNQATMACDLDSYIVFVDVAIYTDWIREQISTD